MAQASGSFHEAQESLSQETMELHRAIMSLMEELEAVDWYAQRVDATSDAALREILAHNRDEEKEHAAMILEWIRRRDPGFDEQLRTHLFREGAIVEREHGGGEHSGEGDGSLGIGDLRRGGSR